MKNTVVDLFSGAGGMSAGFARHPDFEVIGAVDVEVGKPSSGKGSLECNSTYAQNIGIQPFSRDMSALKPQELRALLEEANPQWDGSLNVLISCAPCTGFSRVSGENHLRDDPRNALVGRSGLFVEEFRPDIFFMENARELIMGRFNDHFQSLAADLRQLGYRVRGDIHFLDDFGLPQRRERALIVAVAPDLPLRTLEDLWQGFGVAEEAKTVRRAIGDLPPLEHGDEDAEDPMHVCPRFGRKTSLDRLRAIPGDGGSWADLIDHPEADRLLIPSMKRTVASGKMGRHPDVYGRMWWDRPAITIKRECSNQGNGRYSHPEQDRLLSVREMAILQGFPRDYEFVADSLSNMYRHIGDAVPPLISYQLAHLASWILDGKRPSISDILLPGTHLQPEDVIEVDPPAQRQLSLTKDSSELLDEVPERRVGTASLG